MAVSQVFHYSDEMIADPIQAIDAAFGWRGFPQAMFYHTPFALRFDLGGDLDLGPLRFIQALDRAKAVATALFSGSEALYAVVSIYGEQRTTRRHSAALQQLERIGFRHPFGPATKIPQNDREHIDASGGDLFRHWYGAPFTKDDPSLSALLWTSAARELDIWPKARWLNTIHIADLRNRLALTVYDDRGMDVVGPSGATLSTLYHQFNPWLLDHDRAEMDAKFCT